MENTPKCSVNLALHGSAASSTPHSLLWTEKNELVYASHGVINFHSQETSSHPSTQTLRSSHPSTKSAKITCLTLLKEHRLLVGYNNGAVTLWKTDLDEEEIVFDDIDNNCGVTDLGGICLSNGSIFIVAASALGLRYHYKQTAAGSWENSMFQKNAAFNCVLVKLLEHTNVKQDLLVVLAGSAAPRANRIQAYTCAFCNEMNPAKVSGERANEEALLNIVDQGSLLGHQDWIGCMAWRSLGAGNMLATGSHDHKIRLWLFSTLTNSNQLISPAEESEFVIQKLSSMDDDYDESNIDELLEGEARLILKADHNPSTAITLEAILIGHEDIVTDLSWKPNFNGEAPCLLSSSMDRCVMIWAAEGTDGVWSPIARVGSAGGLLGGSIGSTLLGFVGATWSSSGNKIIGHGYGGAIYVWSHHAPITSPDDAKENECLASNLSIEGGIWKAEPGITGHFGPVEDCCWEPTQGSYLLSASSDQTCRLWAEVGTPDNACNNVHSWKELGRPQVHGYNLTSVVCVGLGRSDGGEPLHRFVSGADEKQLRVFDGPNSTLRLLEKMSIDCRMIHDTTEKRVERAYIPSLGLSNNSEATEDITEFAADQNDMALPLERELGVNSLWPEVSKLFGHDTEIMCLATNAHSLTDDKSTNVIVASSCKARDVENASIRLWNVDKSKCIDVLKVCFVEYGITREYFFMHRI